MTTNEDETIQTPGLIYKRDSFFDTVTVNADDPALRENRLKLLSLIRSSINKIAEFSQIEGGDH